jgi:hypothetical protein
MDEFWSPYSYVGGNPLSLIDVFGLSSEKPGMSEADIGQTWQDFGGTWNTNIPSSNTEITLDDIHVTINPANPSPTPESVGVSKAGGANVEPPAPEVTEPVVPKPAGGGGFTARHGIKGGIPAGLFIAGLSATGVGLIAVAVIGVAYGIADYTGHVDSAIDGGILMTKGVYRSTVKGVNNFANTGVQGFRQMENRLKQGRNPLAGY